MTEASRFYELASLVADGKLSGFAITTDIRGEISRAAVLFEQQDLEKCLAVWQNTNTWFRNKLRSYILNAPEKRFCSEISRLRRREVHEDLVKKVGRRVNDLNKFVSGQERGFDLAQAIDLYSAVCDEIGAVEDEFQIRSTKGLTLQKVG
ncbi:MAG: hypothetical protein WDZ85_03465 [Candidatus Paceibacterota bacterium]